MENIGSGLNRELSRIRLSVFQCKIYEQKFIAKNIAVYV